MQHSTYPAQCSRCTLILQTADALRREAQSRTALEASAGVWQEQQRQDRLRAEEAEAMAEQQQQLMELTVSEMRSEMQQVRWALWGCKPFLRQMKQRGCSNALGCRTVGCSYRHCTARRRWRRCRKCMALCRSSEQSLRL